MSSHVSLLTFKFDNFESLPSKPGSRTFSDEDEVTDANKNKWKAHLYPGGDNVEPPAEGDKERPMTIFLDYKGSSDLDIRLSFMVRNNQGSIVDEIKRSADYNVTHGVALGNDLSMTRSEVLDKADDILVDGTLHVECFIQVQHKVDFKLVPRAKGHFYARPNQFNMLNSLKSGIYSDVSFSIGDEEFPLHKHILNEHSPVLATMCKGGNKDEIIPMPNITSEVFRIVLQYMYGGGLPEIKVDHDGIELGENIIHAADFLEIEALKMEVETMLVSHRVIDLSNVVHVLLLAHEKTCPLLKEYAVEYIIERYTDVLKSKSHEMLTSELKDEIICILRERNVSGDGSNDIRSLPVDTLRRKLGEKGLDIYGSKEVLISRLQCSNKRKRDTK